MRGVGIAFLASDRGDVDDAAVVPFHHVMHDRLAADEGSVEIDAQDLAPFLEVGFPYRLVDPGDAGVVDENVDLAEGLERGVARLFDRGEIRHVDLERGDAGADFLCGLLGERLVMIPDRNLGAGGDKTLGDGAPKPLRAAGDDGAAAVEIDLVHDADSLSRPFQAELTHRSSFRDALFGAGPETILPDVVMDSGLARFTRAPE